MGRTKATRRKPTSPLLGGPWDDAKLLLLRPMLTSVSQLEGNELSGYLFAVNDDVLDTPALDATVSELLSKAGGHVLNNNEDREDRLPICRIVNSKDRPTYNAVSLRQEVQKDDEDCSILRVPDLVVLAWLRVQFTPHHQHYTGGSE